MRYKNMTIRPCTFYGVTFNPGEVHDVPGSINAPGFMQVKENCTYNDATSVSAKSSAKRRKGKLIKEEDE